MAAVGGKGLGLGAAKSSGWGNSQCRGRGTGTKMCNHRQPTCSVPTHVNNHIFLKFMETPSRTGVPEGWGGRNGESLFMGTELPFGVMEKFCGQIVVKVAQHCECT